MIIKIILYLAMFSILSFFLVLQARIYMRKIFIDIQKKKLRKEAYVYLYYFDEYRGKFSYFFKNVIDNTIDDNDYYLTNRKLNLKVGDVLKITSNGLNEVLSFVKTNETYGETKTSKWKVVFKQSDGTYLLQNDIEQQSIKINNNNFELGDEILMKTFIHKEFKDIQYESVLKKEL